MWDRGAEPTHERASAQSKEVTHGKAVASRSPSASGRSAGVARGHSARTRQRTRGPPTGSIRSSAETVAVASARDGGGDVMSSRDRAGLASLAQTRATLPAADGYRVGPDDLLDVRIPDLLDAAPLTGTTRGGGAVA